MSAHNKGGHEVSRVCYWCCSILSHHIVTSSHIPLRFYCWPKTAVKSFIRVPGASSQHLYHLERKRLNVGPLELKPPWMFRATQACHGADIEVLQGWVNAAQITSPLKLESLGQTDGFSVALKQPLSWPLHVRNQIQLVVKIRDMSVYKNRLKYVAMEDIFNPIKHLLVQIMLCIL